MIWGRVQGFDGIDPLRCSRMAVWDAFGDRLECIWNISGIYPKNL